MRVAKPGLVLLYPANLAGAPGAFQGLHACAEQNPASFGACTACERQNPTGFKACTRARSKTRRVSGLAQHARGKTRRVSGLARMRGAKPGGFRGRQGRLPSFPGYLVVTSPGPAGPLWQKNRGAPFLLCVGKRRPEGCSASTSRRRDRATSYVEILLRCCYCPSAQNSFEAMR